MNPLGIENISEAQTRKSSGAQSDSTATCTSVKLASTTVLPKDSTAQKDMHPYPFQLSILQEKLAALEGSKEKQNQEKPYGCHICFVKFSQSSNLRRHMLVHTGEKPYSCAQCNKTFTTASNLKAHAEIHKEAETRDKHSCGTCAKAFLYKSSLVKHQKKCGKEASNDGDSQASSSISRKLVKKVRIGEDTTICARPPQQEVTSIPIQEPVQNTFLNNTTQQFNLLQNFLPLTTYTPIQQPLLNQTMMGSLINLSSLPSSRVSQQALLNDYIVQLSLLNMLQQR